MRLAAFLTVLFFLAAPAAQAREADFSAAELYGMCASSYDTDYGYCAGYVTAVAHAMLSQDVAGLRACGHGRVRGQQFADIFRLYVESHEAQKDKSAPAVIAAALARAFPCNN